MAGDTLRTLKEIADECGGMASFKLGDNRVVLVNDADSIRDVLITHHRDFIKTDESRTQKLHLGGGLGGSEGDSHHRHRRLVQKAFHQDKIASYAEVVVNHVTAVCDNWKESEILDIAEEMTRITLPIIMRLVFSRDALEDSEYRKFRGVLEAVQRSANTAMDAVPLLPQKGDSLSERSRAFMDGLIYEMIEERRKNGVQQDDILSMLIGGRDAGIAAEKHDSIDGGSLSDKQIRDEAMTLLVAANATTPIALAWTWYLLSQHEDVESKLVGELDYVIKDRVPTAADYPRLRFVRQVLAESMRLYPPTWLMGRKAMADVSVAGYTIPEGSIVLMSQYLMHHDSRYFSEPDSFVPDRWTPGFENALPKVSYFPFGAGPRSCIGEPLAWMEAVLTIATIAQKWHLGQPKGQESIGQITEFSIPPSYTSRCLPDSASGANVVMANPRYVVSRALSPKPILVMSPTRRRA